MHASAVLSGVQALHLHRRRLELTIDAILAVPGDSQAVDLLPSTAALCLAWRAGAASFCSRSGSGLELVVGGLLCRDAFGFVLVCLDTLAISLVDCVDRFYVAARRSTGYGYTNSRSCSAAAIPASLAALECRFRLSLPPGHPLLTAAHTLTPRLQCCEYLPQRCTTLLRSAANGLTYRELPSAHTLQRRR